MQRNTKQSIWKWVANAHSPDDMLKHVINHCVLHHKSGIYRPAFIRNRCQARMAWQLEVICEGGCIGKEQPRNQNTDERGGEKSC